MPCRARGSRKSVWLPTRRKIDSMSPWDEKPQPRFRRNVCSIGALHVAAIAAFYFFGRWHAQSHAEPNEIVWLDGGDLAAAAAAGEQTEIHPASVQHEVPVAAAAAPEPEQTKPDE